VPGVVPVAAMYLVAELVPEFRVGGGVVARLLLLAALAGIWTLAAALLIVPAAVVASMVLLGSAVRRADRVPVDDTPVEDFRPAPREGFAALFLLVLWVMQTAAVGPAALWLAVRSCDVVGAPVHLGGGWTAYMTASLLNAGFAGAGKLLLRVVPLRSWAGAFLSYASIFAVVWLFTATGLAGVEADDGVPFLVAVLVPAVLIAELRFVAPGRLGWWLQAPIDVLATVVAAWLTAPTVAQWTPDSRLVAVLIGCSISVAGVPARLLNPPKDAADLVRFTGRVRRRPD
jgi:hypothetical protein